MATTKSGGSKRGFAAGWIRPSSARLRAKAERLATGVVVGGVGPLNQVSDLRSRRTPTPTRPAPVFRPATCVRA